ncbi:MAG: DUF4386 domain-containing protein [Desulfobacterales bacterium]|nr:DUF4386 domain-containing protein [Desulfobacterales bacterium]
MTRTLSAKIAGFTLLFYIAVSICSMVLFGSATGGDGVAAQLAGIAQHTTEVRVTVVLDLLCCFSALVLGVTLYAITREQDSALAMLAMVCRAGEGFLGATGIPKTLGLLWLASTPGAGVHDTTSAQALGAYLLQDNVALTSTFFAVGSLIFAWLLLRGRMIPAWLGWLGVTASVLLVVCLPLQLTGLLRGPATSFMWMPMFAFEVPLALWLLIRGAAIPGPRRNSI